MMNLEKAKENLAEAKANFAYWQTMVNQIDDSDKAKSNDDDQYDFVIHDDDRYQQLEQRFLEEEHFPKRVPRGGSY